MKDIQRIIQRIRELADSFGASSYAASKTVLENSGALLKIFERNSKNKALPKLTDLRLLVDKRLRDYWPRLRAEMGEVGIWSGGQENRTKELIVRAILDSLIDARSTPEQPDPILRNQPRLELDEARKRLCIDGKPIDYAGEKATYFLTMLLKARGQWELGEKLEDPVVVVPRADKVLKRLPSEIRDIIESRRGGKLSGGYRIKPEFFL